MNNSQILLNNLHKIFRKDEYIKANMQNAGLQLDKIENKIRLIEKEFLFSTMSHERVKKLEKELDYKTKSDTLEGKRLEIEARWKTSGKCDLELLQIIAETWQADTVEIKFIDGNLEVEFLSTINADYDLKGLKNSLDEAKPAHLWFDLTFTEQLKANIYQNCYGTEEIEQDFIEKEKEIILRGNYKEGIWMEVEEEHGI
ncbi:putative phage tail protein [Fusobacterium ulcerans]|uniref:DUF2313 domain-containing protein n=1 Tax=Fusobacterium ulcerans 12-1B TaxID=457404 RepID=H1PTQ2_9FUSO|nr:DUF2313 domain-containing protein [Fusobacterium ulcerans]EHO80722.1 hypothetical protein HMPREF0402_01795 [Fusobacterium ulcerans 12-1B]